MMTKKPSKRTGWKLREQSSFSIIKQLPDDLLRHSLSFIGNVEELDVIRAVSKRMAEKVVCPRLITRRRWMPTPVMTNIAFIDAAGMNLTGEYVCPETCRRSAKMTKKPSKRTRWKLREQSSFSIIKQLPDDLLRHSLSFIGNVEELDVIRAVSKRMAEKVVCPRLITRWKGLPTPVMTNVEFVDISEMNLTGEYVCPETCRVIVCFNNKLTSLVVNEGCREIICFNNQLTSLNVPSSCKTLYCFKNRIKSLTIPNGCKIVDCSLNRLESITVPDECKHLDCSVNQLKSLSVSDCEYLNCSKNQLDFLNIKGRVQRMDASENNLRELTVPEGCQRVFCSSNKLRRLILPEGIHVADCSDNELLAISVPFSCTDLYMEDNPDECILL